MEICDFVYHSPRSMAEACVLGREYGAAARYLAGGTELLADLKQRRDTTQHVISLRGIAELHEIRREGGGLRIGALATLEDVAASPQVLDSVPALSEAIQTMAALQIRNRGTLGGNFCSGVPSADTPPICIALGASVVVMSPEEERELPAEEFFRGPRQVALEPGEVLAWIRLPEIPSRSGASYQRLALRGATALAVVGVAARLDMDGDRIAAGRIALGAVAPVPLLARSCGGMLQGQAPSEDLFGIAAAAAAEECKPISDLRGSADYRRETVRILTLRALRTAFARAEGR